MWENEGEEGVHVGEDGEEEGVRAHVGEEGEEQDGSRMIVICEMHACLLGGSGGMPPRKILNLYIYLSELLLMQSGTKFLNI